MTGETDTSMLYDDRLEHCPCGERTCLDTLNGEQAHYRVNTRVNGESVGEQRLQDPFIVSTTVVGWPDLLRALFKGSLTLRVEVSGCRPITGAVVRLGRMTETELTQHIERMDAP